MMRIPTTSAVCLGAWPALGADVIGSNHARGNADEGPSIVAGHDEPSLVLDATGGIDVEPLPLYRQMADSVFAIYSQPDDSLEMGKNTIIACMVASSGKWPGEWSLEDYRRADGTLWARLWWRLANGTALWIRSKEGAFERQPGRPDALVITQSAGVVSLWANGSPIVFDAVDSDLRTNPASLRFGAYLGGLGLWSGLLQGASIYAGQVSSEEIAAMPPAKAVVLTPPPEPIESEPDGRVTKYRNLGEISGTEGLIKLDVGGEAHYDFSGTIRVTRLKGTTWQGTRNLFDMRSMPAHVGARVTGALICPDLTADYDWGPLYQSGNHPRGALHILYTIAKDMTFEHVRAHGLGWDFAQIGDRDDGDVENLTFRRCGITLQRDDAFENDARTKGLLIDECYVESFVLFSSRNKNSARDGSSRVTTMRKSLHYLLPCRFEGIPNQIAPIFKLDSRSERFLLMENIFAIPDGTPFNSKACVFGDLLRHGKLHPNSAGNVVCWLGKGSFPHDAPKGFKILTGGEARNTWEKALADWWRGFQGHRFPFDPK